jgi:hypothetical protein
MLLLLTGILKGVYRLFLAEVNLVMLILILPDEHLLGVFDLLVCLGSHDFFHLADDQRELVSSQLWRLKWIVKRSLATTITLGIHTIADEVSLFLYLMLRSSRM